MFFEKFLKNELFSLEMVKSNKKFIIRSLIFYFSHTPPFYFMFNLEFFSRFALDSVKCQKLTILSTAYVKISIFCGSSDYIAIFTKISLVEGEIGV